MAHFRATIVGQKGEASRLGSKRSGLTVTANSWHCGVTVEVEHNRQANEDIFRVYRTLGSSPEACSSNQQLIASWVCGNTGE